MADFIFTEDMIGIRAVRRPGRDLGGALRSPLDPNVPTVLNLSADKYVYLPVRKAGLTDEALAALKQFAGISDEPAGEKPKK